MKKTTITSIFILISMTFFVFILSNNAEAVAPTKLYLQSDTYLPCAANGSVKFKGGTYVLVDSSNLKNVMSGTLAQDTNLYYTLNYSPNKQVPAMRAKFRSGTTVEFIAGQGSLVGLVSSGELAEDTKFRVFSGSMCNVNFSFAPVISYKAGSKINFIHTYVSGYPQSGILAQDTRINIDENTFLKFKGGTSVIFPVNPNGYGAFIIEGTLAGPQEVPFFNSGRTAYKLLPVDTIVRFTLIGVCDYYILPNGTKVNG